LTSQAPQDVSTGGSDAAVDESRVIKRAAWILTGLTLATQIAWPLTPTDPTATGDARDILTVVIVLSFGLATALWVLAALGSRALLYYLAVTLGIGFLVEAVGTGTGFPFGAYSYANSLGYTVFGVPLVVPVAWSMMAYPALAAARALTNGRLLTPVVGAVALASWDLFLDPQMVGDGHWSFVNTDLHLPGIDGIPLSNFAGWFATALVMMALLDRLPRERAIGGPPAVLYLWTWVGGIAINLTITGRPWVALWGGAIMGLICVPYAIRLVRARA